jgi:hypothetical protein
MTTKKFLMGFIALNSIIQFFLMIMLWVNLKAVLDFLKLENSDGLHVFVVYFISAIMIIFPVGFLAISWLLKNKAEGIILARLIGITMIVAATNVGFGLHRFDLAAVDLIRAIPITILAFMPITYRKEMNKI